MIYLIRTLAALVVTGVSATCLANPTFLGPSEYLSFTQSPYSGIEFEYFELEDFEDGLLNAPGVSITSVRWEVVGPGAFTDSVDEDDGVVDGSGLGGYSLNAQTDIAGVPTTATFTFDPTVIDLPTHVGIVWTDAESPRQTGVSIEALGPTGNSLGIFGPHDVGDNTTRGTTLEDRFLGVIDPDGISAIRIFQDAGQMEVDHLQYGHSGVPLAISTKLFPLLLGESFRTTMETVGGVPPFSWSLTNGAIPEGMALQHDGVLDGVPTRLGITDFTIEARDGNGDIASRDYTVEVVLVFPPAEVQFNISGTETVPGRTVDYFIVVENTGSALASGVEALQLLLPSTMFNLQSTTPDPDEATTNRIFWTLKDIEPGGFAVLSFAVALDPTLPLGVPVPVSIFTGPQNSSNAAVLGLAEHLAENVSNPLRKFPECVIKDKASQVLICAKIGCIIDGPACRACLDLAEMAVEPCKGSLGVCDLYPWPFKTLCENTNIPKDPNDKIVVADKFIRNSQILVYPIRFENIGMIEALDVFITDVLDPSLDDSTLQILTPGGTYNPSTRTLRWELLGRNLQPGETGNVLLSIKPSPNLPSGTEIRNNAEIQFEIFETLVTPDVINVIDTTPPNCTMNLLPSESIATEITLSWTGTDDVGEIDGFSIFHSVNDGGFAPLLVESLETNILFSGVVGEEHHFFCVAKDTVGNVEDQQLVAETSVLFVADTAGVIFSSSFEDP